MITDEQRARRKTGIFSSDVPRIIAGDGPRVALEKLGHLPEANLDDIMEVEIGSMIEGSILNAYEAQMRCTLVRSPDTIRHPQWDWMGAHLDSFLPAVRDVEAKSVGPYARFEWGNPFTDEVPDRVLWQTQEQMAVTGLPEAHVAVCFIDADSLKHLLTGRTPPITIYIVQRSEKLIAHLTEVSWNVWDCVQSGRLPKPEKPSDARLIYRKGDGGMVEADDATYQVYLELMEARENKTAWSNIEEHRAFELQEYMKEAAELRYNGRMLATWKLNNGRKGYTVEPLPPYRTFLPKEPKK